MADSADSHPAAASEAPAKERAVSMFGGKGEKREDKDEE